MEAAITALQRLYVFSGNLNLINKQFEQMKEKLSELEMELTKLKLQLEQMEEIITIDEDATQDDIVGE